MVVELSELLGKTLSSIEVTGDDEVIFTTDDGAIYKLYHEQDCCESVVVEEVIGDLADLVGAPILMAEEVSNADAPVLPDEDSYTWTF